MRALVVLLSMAKDGNRARCGRSMRGGLLAAVVSLLCIASPQAALAANGGPCTGPIVTHVGACKSGEENQPPVAKLKVSPPSDADTKAPARVRLDGSDSWDPDAKIPVGWRPSCRDECSPLYRWTFEVDGPDGFKWTANGQARYPDALSIRGPYQTASSRLVLPNEGYYTISLTVYDPQGAHDQTQMGYSVGPKDPQDPVGPCPPTPPRHPKQSDSGSDQNRPPVAVIHYPEWWNSGTWEPTAVRLDALGSYDPDDTGRTKRVKLDYLWLVDEWPDDGEGVKAFSGATLERYYRVSSYVTLCVYDMQGGVSLGAYWSIYIDPENGQSH